MGTVWTVDFVCCARAICWPLAFFLLLVVAALSRRKKNFYIEKIYCWSKMFELATKANWSYMLAVKDIAEVLKYWTKLRLTKPKHRRSVTVKANFLCFKRCWLIWENMLPVKNVTGQKYCRGFEILNSILAKGS